MGSEGGWGSERGWALREGRGGWSSEGGGGALTSLSHSSLVG